MEHKAESPDKNSAAPALDKGLDILELLCQTEVGLTQQDITARLGRNLGEIYRMLNCLVRRNYVANEGSVYTITSKLFQLSHFHPPIHRLITEAMPIMDELARSIAFPCDLRVYNNGIQTVIAAIQPPNGLGFMTRVGAEIPVATSSSGLVLLAFQDDETRETRITKCLSDQSDSEIAEYRARLAHIAAQGFASVQSRQYAGLHAISFPILDINGHALAAMTVPMLARIDGQAQTPIHEIEAKLAEATRVLSGKMQYKSRQSLIVVSP
jgi:DNA-binding IclR family transcriptional regulator